jgi:hypothetical protein
MDSASRAADGRSTRPARSVRGSEGQASVELLAGVPALLLAGLLSLQLLAAGLTLTLSDGAVEAAAIAVAAGHDPEPAVRRALPGWARGRVDVDRKGGRLTVTLRPPSPIEGLARRLEVSSSAWVRPRS